jgi:hypothetical protein
MSQPNNLRRCHTTLDQDRSLIAVVEMSQPRDLKTRRRGIQEANLGFRDILRAHELPDVAEDVGRPVSGRAALRRVILFFCPTRAPS